MAKRNRGRRGINPIDLTIAKGENDVTYGPQIAQIGQLYRDAAEQRAGDITAAKQNARGTIQYAKQARPEVKGVFRQGAGAVRAAQGDVNTAVHTLGGATPLLAGVLAREQGGARSRIAEARTGALQELIDRAQSARAGQALAVTQARGDYQKSKSTLDQKLSDLLGQSRSAMAARLGTLYNERADRGLKRDIAAAGQTGKDSEVFSSGAFAGRTHAWVRNHPKQAQGLVDKYNAMTHPPKTGKGKSGGGGQTAKQRGDFSDAVGAAMQQARAFVGPDSSKAERETVADKLLRGQLIPTGGDANDQIPKFGQLAASIALDQLIDRHISRPNTKALHQRELSVADLNNVTSFTDWLKTPAGKAWKRTQANTRTYGNQGNLGPTGHM
jgi:hypothetical protein